MFVLRSNWFQKNVLHLCFERPRISYCLCFESMIKVLFIPLQYCIANNVKEIHKISPYKPIGEIFRSSKIVYAFFWQSEQLKSPVQYLIIDIATE